MIKKWLSWINLFIASTSISMLVLAVGLTLLRPWEIHVIEEISAKNPLPKSAFVLPKPAYDAIATSALSLKFSPMTFQLPDLRKALTFYGKNGRPDARNKLSPLHFAFNGNKTISSILPGERLYITYDKTLTPAQYVFSPHNTPTLLWIEAEIVNNEAVIRVAVQDEEGKIIHEPASHAQFTLVAKEFGRQNGTSWEIGKWRVDGSLLARQKARWYGLDKFLQKHGGVEYEALQNKQRIDFGENEEAYSVFVGVGDCLAWTNDHWSQVSPGEESLGKPLLCVNKVDERLINLELWDVEGKAKVNVNLLKSHEAWLPKNLEQSFRFVGARTRSQYVFEIDNERITLRPHDWLVMTDEGWKKLTTAEEIDEYVDRKLTGPLFVFDGIEKKDDRQVLLGTMFNASRTDLQSIELALMQGGPSTIERSPEEDVPAEKVMEEMPTPVARTFIPNNKSPVEPQDDEE